MITTRNEHIDGHDVFIATYGGIIDRVTMKAGSSVVSKFIWSADNEAYLMVDVTEIASPSERLLSLLEDHWVRAQFAPGQSPNFILISKPQHAATYREWLLNVRDGSIAVYHNIGQALSAINTSAARPA